jgi:hypothetical protein
MKARQTVKWMSLLALLALALAAAGSATVAQEPEAAEPSAISCGDAAYCFTSGPSLYVRNAGSGEAIYGENVNAGAGFGVRGRGNPGVYGTSVAAAGVRGVSVNAKGVKGESTSNDGVYAKSVSGRGLNAMSGTGYGIFSTSGDLEGVRATSTGAGTADHGITGITYSTNSTSEAGVYGLNNGTGESVAGPGVYGRGQGNSTGYGVRGWANEASAVYGDSDSADGWDYGGWFTGPQGVYGQAEMSSHDGVTAVCDAGGACYGIESSSASSYGGYLWTGRSDNNYGLYSPDNIHAAGYYSDRGLAFFAENGGDVALEVGDLVAVVGMAGPLPDSDVPLMVVQRADAASAVGIVGVVQSAWQIEMVSKPLVRYNLTEMPDGEGGEPDYVYLPEATERQVPVHSAIEGPVQPGGLMVLAVQGLAQVRADAAGSAIQAGDPLTAGADGWAVKAEQIAPEGGVPTYAAGTLVGKALEPLADGQALIWALVDLR